ncbi:MAG: hypothetical protein Q7S05_01350 [bacterium]|nr:hypothetical protein [bacterium]
MNPVVETALFWGTFVAVSGWILSRFYFSKTAALRSRLRAVACCIEIATLGLLFFAFIPTESDRTAVITALFLLLLIAAVFLFTTNPRFLKIAAGSHFLGTIYIFALMIWIFPSTIVLTPRDVAMVIAALCMLTNTVVLLLLWNQLEKSGTRMKTKSKELVLVLIGVVVVTLAVLLASTPRGETSILHSGNGFAPLFTNTWTEDRAVAEVSALPEVRDFENMLAKTGKVAVIEIEGENSDWAVHVFEIVRNDDGTSHTATFGWYRVDKTTGEMEKEL